MPPRPGRDIARDQSGGESPPGKTRRWPWLLGGLAVLAIGGGLLAFTMMVGNPTETAQPPARLIETAMAQPARQVTLRQTGFARPVAKVDLSSEIAGRMTDVAEGLRRGAFVEQGQTLIQLETRQLRAEVGRAQAAVGEARAALTQARVERDRQEELEAREFASEAVLQQAIVAVATAEARLTGARAELVAARSRLEDATIDAPFDALVISEAADVGDIARPGSVLAELVASEAVEVEFGLTPAATALLGTAERAIGGRVFVRPVDQMFQSDGATLLATGEVTEVGAQVEAASRTVPLIVRIERPFAPTEGDRPLRIEELVALELPVSLQNRTAVRLPSSALKGGDTVWAIRSEENAHTLARVDVTVLSREGETVVVEGALPEGARVMTSDLPGAASGLRVRLAQDEPADPSK